MLPLGTQPTAAATAAAVATAAVVATTEQGAATACIPWKEPSRGACGGRHADLKESFLV